MDANANADANASAADDGATVAADVLLPPAHTDTSSLSLAAALDDSFETVAGVATATDAPSPSAALDLAGLARWITCVCVVHFDLELGQALECVYPPSTHLSESEAANVCFAAFSDSNSSGVGDISYTFRIRKAPLAETTADDLDDPARALRLRQNSFVYGFVLFRQRKDASIKRGYFQKSVVILSSRPYMGLFREMVRLLAPAYFEMGQPILEAACETISKWPPPMPGQTYELPFLGSILHVRLPQLVIPQYNNHTPAPLSLGIDESLILPIRGVSIFACFSEILGHLWHCWELTLLAQPLVVMSTSPKIGSESVLSLVSLISPIPFGGDYRPYFTIHDSDFRDFTAKAKTPPNVILGVTNPFFIKALEHWPNILRVSASHRLQKESSPSKPTSNGTKSSLDFVEGITSAYKPLVAVDKALLKRIQEMGPDQAALIDELLLNHFAELTRSFLVPLERYFVSLVPMIREVTPWKSPPRPKPFNASQFMAYLNEIGPQVPLRNSRKSKWASLYTNFLNSPNFLMWLKLRTKQAEVQLRRVYLRALQDADVAAWIKTKHEVVCVDFMLRLQQELRMPLSVQFLGEAGVRTLRSHIDIIVQALPEDLSRSILSSPSHDKIMDTSEALSASSTNTAVNMAEQTIAYAVEDAA